MAVLGLIGVSLLPSHNHLLDTLLVCFHTNAVLCKASDSKQLASSITNYLFLSPPLLRLTLLFGSDSLVFELSEEPAIFAFVRTGSRYAGGLGGWPSKGVISLALLERRRIEVGIPEAISIELLSDIWVCLEVLLVLVGVFPDASRRVSLGIDLSMRADISVR